MVDTSLIYTSRINECLANVERDFNDEWSKKKIKWFFGAYRQKKLRIKIYRRNKFYIEAAIDAFNDWFFQKDTKENEDV